MVELPVGEAYLTIEGEGVTSLLVIGGENTPVLLGVTTLELLGLQVDPINGKLKPLDLLIMQWSFIHNVHQSTDSSLLIEAAKQAFERSRASSSSDRDLQD